MNLIAKSDIGILFRYSKQASGPIFLFLYNNEVIKWLI